MTPHSRHALHACILGCLIGAAPLVVSTEAGAVPTASFEAATFKALSKGHPKGTLISSQGDVLPGYGSRLIATKTKTLMYWSRVKASDGTLYLGGGQPAKIYALKGGKLRVVADLKAVLVSALTFGPGGQLLAGTLPDARILSVDPHKGTWRELARLPSKHVWDLLYDAKAQRIYAAGGAPGKVYSISPRGGKPSVYYDAGEKHLLFLAQDPKGALLTGGSDKAILYRVTSKDHAGAIHDFDATELHRVAVATDGTIYVAVNKFPKRTAGLPRYDRPKKGKGGTPIVKKGKTKPAAFRAAELRPGTKSGKGALFRISPDGRAKQLHALKTGYFTDVAIDARGQVWAAEGTKGRVFVVRGDELMKVFDVKQRQVLALDVSGKIKHFATGDGGAIFRIDDTPKGRPVYLSEALDAKVVARWGNLRYHATAKLTLASRSGNTAKPDKTWASWKPARVLGKALVTLKSKPARYLQIRATWQGKGALRSFEAFYRPQNQAATIKEFTYARNEKKPEERKIKLKWKVDNADKDKLVYRLFVREELGATWRPLNEGKVITKTSYEWDTSAFADDTYRVKLVVSDERANGPTSTQKRHKISLPIILDNRRPDVAALQVRYPHVSGVAKDSYSRIKTIEYRVDSGEWRLIDARDGIYDSTMEAFRIALPTIKRRGSHTLTIRVTDEADNAGIRKQRFVR
ncbi:MAG: hypothetical protein KAI47_17300 [Deltaproteobacteria bacterium]|nr:hypothetical protein [Deltaproteobacteria bacterium]